MEKDQIINEVAKELGIAVTENNYSFNRQQLIDQVNKLVANDFDKLISILYRMDVSEPKLKLLLKNNPGEDAGLLIADLMIERQAQKIRSRQQFSKRDNDIDDENKW